MQMISKSAAFRGLWAVHPVGWVLFLVPLGLLVVLQESETPFPTLGWVLISALVQHIIAGGLIVGVGTLVYRLRGAVPLAFTFALWTVSGALRGLIGGWFAMTLAGVAPEYGLRIAYWVVATLVWMPLATYLLTQFDLRQQLLIGLDTVNARVERERAASRRSTEQRAGELVAAVRDAVTPLIGEVRSTLSTAATNDTEIPLDAISHRLEAISDEARAVIQHSSAISAPTVRAAPIQWSPLTESLVFSSARPGFLALFTVLSVTSLFLIDSFRVGGTTEVLEHLAAITAGGVALTVALLAARRAPRFAPVHAMIVFLIAALATELTLVAVDVDADSIRDTAMFLVVPLAFVASTRIIASAVGLGLGNVKLIAALNEREEQLQALIDSARAQEDEIVGKVSLVLHGPVLGRLSACIMAINFYLAEPTQSRGLRRTATTDGVLAHLELVAEDLEKLTSR